MKLEGAIVDEIVYENIYNILGNKVKVYFVKGWSLEFFGCYDNAHNSITIDVDSNLSNSKMINLIMHEVTHAVDFDMYNYQQFENAKEKLALFVSKYALDILNISTRILEDYKLAIGASDPLSDRPLPDKPF